MERVTRSSALTELPARPDVEGDPGFFGPGDKTTGTPASVPGYEWFNMVQEELCNVVTQLGGTPLSGDVYDQVSNAILVAISQAVPDSIDWDNVLNKPSSYPPSGHGHSWSGISDKPTTFPPSGHSHSIANITDLQATLDAIIPTGTIAWFSVATAPSGWLKCNGALLSRSTYSQLFAAFGVTYGAGDGATTFALPDLRGQFIRGWDDGRGIDAGRVFGAEQSDAIRNIIGRWGSQLYTEGSGSCHFPLGDDDARNSLSGAFKTASPTAAGYRPAGATTAIGSGIEFDASQVVPTASDNRPKNIALLPCIKY